ncbi:hypothetical protein FE634_22090 [Nocardioides dongxiaopingii]|uniref:hypothetical protein n=1 Tax=Nocardioides sp. S-1144 TaxID=2582905 RepID=UPI0011658455|nr:hypothetical protein [Nocardioides sp. S-1144]QDH11156.1 hypothetical protein FE634_22090 [Nocardioides sp. S-1144]
MVGAVTGTAAGAAGAGAAAAGTTSAGVPAGVPPWVAGVGTAASTLRRTTVADPAEKPASAAVTPATTGACRPTTAERRTSAAGAMTWSVLHRRRTGRRVLRASPGAAAEAASPGAVWIGAIGGGADPLGSPAAGAGPEAAAAWAAGVAGVAGVAPSIRRRTPPGLRPTATVDVVGTAAGAAGTAAAGRPCCWAPGDAGAGGAVVEDPAAGATAGATAGEAVARTCDGAGDEEGEATGATSAEAIDAGDDAAVAVERRTVPPAWRITGLDAVQRSRRAAAAPAAAPAPVAGAAWERAMRPGPAARTASPSRTALSSPRCWAEGNAVAAATGTPPLPVVLPGTVAADAAGAGARGVVPAEVGRLGVDAAASPGAVERERAPALLSAMPAERPDCRITRLPADHTSRRETPGGVAERRIRDGADAASVRASRTPLSSAARPAASGAEAAVCVAAVAGVRRTIVPNRPGPEPSCHDARRTGPAAEEGAAEAEDEETGDEADDAGVDTAAPDGPLTGADGGLGVPGPEPPEEPPDGPAGGPPDGPADGPGGAAGPSPGSGPSARGGLVGVALAAAVDGVRRTGGAGSGGGATTRRVAWSRERSPGVSIGPAAWTSTCRRTWATWAVRPPTMPPGV